jgi:hypothetical protein
MSCGKFLFPTPVAATLVLGLVCLLARPAGAVDGIAVSIATHIQWQAYFDTLWRYDIKNNRAVKKVMLCADRCRYPAINVQGTHVAFFRRTSRTAETPVYLSGMPHSICVAARYGNRSMASLSVLKAAVP